MSARDKANRVLIHVILILVSITMLVPFLWMILTAFKTMTEATSVNPFVILPSTWRWDSFREVSANMDFLHLYINTLLLILGRVVCAVLTATLAGYAFGRLNFRGKNLMFSLVLFQMMVPGQIFIIPQYLMVSKMGMLNTSVKTCCLFQIFWKSHISLFEQECTKCSNNTRKYQGKNGIEHSHFTYH